MIKTLTIAILAFALAGCGMFESKDAPLDPGYTSSNVATTAPTPTIETLTTAPAPAARPTTVNTRYIDIGPVLDKLNDMGCVIDKLELREVSRGGHASINCVKRIDALNADIDKL